MFVTPLTAGSFDLPEESRRIVKAQMYSLEGSGINLYARPIEGVQAIVDLDTQQVIQILDTGVIPVPTASHNFDEDSARAQVGLRDPTSLSASRNLKATTSHSPTTSWNGKSGVFT